MLQQAIQREQEIARQVKNTEADSFQPFLDSVSVFKLERLKEACKFEAADGKHGPSAALQDVVEAECGKLVHKWGENPERPQLSVPDRLCNELATPENIRKASNRFKAGTSLSLDGIHPRMLTLMSDQGLETLALIYQTMEAIGAPPRQLAYLEFPFIPKAGSGPRAILSQPGIIRVWEALQADANLRYAEDNDRPYFGMGKLRSPELFAYVQTARFEAHTEGAETQSSDVAVALQVDGRSYYESFVSSALFGRYRDTGGSHVAAKFLFNCWRMARVARLSSFFNPTAILPIGGIPAGSMFNRVMCMAYVIKPFDAFVARYPKCDLLHRSQSLRYSPARRAGS